MVQTAKEAILEACEGGRFATVRFIKRTTGEVRTMNFRLGVAKYIKGVGLAYEPDQKGLMVVFDMHRHSPTDSGYRMIALEGVLEVRGEGKGIIWEKPIDN